MKEGLDLYRNTPTRSHSRTGWIRERWEWDQQEWIIRDLIPNPSCRHYHPSPLLSPHRLLSPLSLQPIPTSTHPTVSPLSPFLPAPPPRRIIPSFQPRIHSPLISLIPLYQVLNPSLMDRQRLHIVRRQRVVDRPFLERQVRLDNLLVQRPKWNLVPRTSRRGLERTRWAFWGGLD